MSTAWQYPPEHTRGDERPASRRDASARRGREGSDRDPLHPRLEVRFQPRSTPTPLLAGKRLLSSFFGDGVGIGHRYRPTLAFAHGGPGLAPAPIFPPVQAALVQDAPQGERADRRKPIGSLAQRALQGGEGPRPRPIGLPVRIATCLLENA